MSKYTFKSTFTFIYLHILYTLEFCLPVFIEFPPNARHSSRTEDTGTTHTKHMYSPCVLLVESRRNVTINNCLILFLPEAWYCEPSCM